MGTAINHPVPDRVEPSVVIFDIRVLLRSRLSVRVPRCQKLQITASVINPVWLARSYGNTARQRVNSDF